MLASPVLGARSFYQKFIQNNDWAVISKKIIARMKPKRGETRKAFAARKALALQQAAANLYLQFRYGVQPLISSINDVVAAVKAGEASTDIQSWNRTAVIEESNSGSKNFSNGGESYSITWITNHTVKIRAVAVGRMGLTNALKYGFCSKSLFTLPWELVNKSFVADWMANIGSVIGSLAPSAEATWLGGCWTKEEIVQTTFTLQYLGSTRLVPQTPTGSWVVTRRTKTRTVGLPPPRLVIRDSFRMSGTRVLDAVALLSTSINSAARKLGPWMRKRRAQQSH
nr:MAG: maturation protein [Sanya solspi-like virus 5]